MKDATEGTNIQLILIGDHHDHNCTSFETMLKDQGDIIDGYVTSPASVVVLPYSSGTTGVPKRVQLTHWNLVAQMEQLAQPGGEASGHGAGDRMCLALVPHLCHARDNVHHA